MFRVSRPQLPWPVLGSDQVRPACPVCFDAWRGVPGRDPPPPPTLGQTAALGRTELLNNESLTTCLSIGVKDVNLYTSRRDVQLTQSSPTPPASCHLPLCVLGSSSFLHPTDGRQFLDWVEGTPNKTSGELTLRVGVQTNGASIILGTKHCPVGLQVGALSLWGGGQWPGSQRPVWSPSAGSEPPLLVPCQMGVSRGLPLAFILRLNELIGVKPLNGCLGHRAI